MAVLIVLALVAVSLALSYAVMRVNATGEQIHANSQHRGDARQVAMTGLSIGLRKMHEGASWVGVGGAISGSLNSYDSYRVTYTLGDAKLTSADPKYGMYPFRVTVLSTGSSRDPGADSVATHTVQAVVELVPTTLSSAPTDWSYVQPYTLTQRSNDEFKIHMPLQISGPVRLQGAIEINPRYQNFFYAGDTYFDDLKKLLTNTGADYRPLTGPIHWKQSRQWPYVNTWLLTKLSLTAADTADKSVASWYTLAPNATYQLYPRGPTYNVSSAPTQVTAGTTLAADPVTNPLGVFYSNDKVRLWDNVTVRGMLISDGSSGEVQIEGPNVQISPVDLPPLDGDSAKKPVRVPTIVTKSLTQLAGASGTIKGFASVDTDVDLNADTQDAVFSLQGKLVATRLYVRERTQWDSLNWSPLLGLFNLLSGIVPLFPDWAESNYNAKKAPKIIIKGDTSAVTYHWLTRGVPLYDYEAPASGKYLRWDMIRFTDNP